MIHFFIERDGTTKFFYRKTDFGKVYNYIVSSKNGVVMMESRAFTSLRDAKRHYSGLLEALWG